MYFSWVKYTWYMHLRYPFLLSLVAGALTFSTSCHTSEPDVKAVADSLAAASNTPVDNPSAAQTPASSFLIAKQAVGDLNKDGLRDSVVALKDTSDESRPYRLSVYFGQPDGSYKKVLETSTAIGPEYPEGSEGEQDYVLQALYLTNGNLDINVEQHHRSAHHLFKFRDDKFELIGFGKDELDGPNNGIIGDEYNLLTGRHIHFSADSFSKSKKVLQEDKVTPPSPLPTLDNFTPFQSKGEIPY